MALFLVLPVISWFFVRIWLHVVVYRRYCWESPLRHRVRAHSPREKFSLCLPHMLGCHQQDTFKVKCLVKCFSILAYIMNSDSTSQCSVLCQNCVPPPSKVEPKRGTESHFLVALWNTSSALVQIFPECAVLRNGGLRHLPTSLHPLLVHSL